MGRTHLRYQTLGTDMEAVSDAFYGGRNSGGGEGTITYSDRRVTPYSHS
jgi:hypothetical protein